MKRSLFLIGAIGLIFQAAEGADADQPPRQSPAERSDFQCSATWEETRAYIATLATLSPLIETSIFGKTEEGRDLLLVSVGKPDEENDREKPLVLILAGIHSAEICGKDAILIFLRDVALGREKRIVENTRLRIVPVFNLDGHERLDLYNRFTQVGPECGGGTPRNARRLDLNRDYAKLESAECRALVRLANEIEPHLFIDLHTDDGIGHQYDILFGAGVNPTLPGARAELVRERMTPGIVDRMTGDGFRSRSIGYPFDRVDLSKGIGAYGISALVGTGYFDYRHTICLLAEANPYVPYERRVRATGSFLRAALRFAVDDDERLVRTVEEARRAAIEWAAEPGVHSIGLVCRADRERPEPIDWLGKKFETIRSEVTGDDYALYGDEDTTCTVPFFPELKATVSAPMPRGYLIDRAWSGAARRLADHGIAVDVLADTFHTEAEVFHFESVDFRREPYQGRHPVRGVEGKAVREERAFPPGTMWVGLDQPAGITAMVLLEPRSPDALLAWNLFDSIFERGIVLERWALEENARKMLSDDTIRAEYEAALADSAFAADETERLLFFFRKTDYEEEGRYVYPVCRIDGAAPPPAVFSRR